MRWNSALLVAIALAATGCSQTPVAKQAPVSVSGRVSQAGQPVGNVVLTFHPLDNGHVSSVPVNPDGTFQGQLIVGNYSYYVGKSLAPNAEAALKKIAPKYYEADLDRSVSVEAGKEIILALD